MTLSSSTKTVVVLGAAYGGVRASQLLAAGLPDGWRLILIDRNSHAHHVYAMPRYLVLPGHEHKAFIPYQLRNKHANSPHLFLQAHIISMTPHSVTLSRSFPEHGFPTPTIQFDFAVYALGSKLSSPLDLWAPERDPHLMTEHLKEKDMVYAVYQGEKKEAISWLKDGQKLVEAAPNVLIVGGGALGVQLATDIVAVHLGKPVTLLHSRARLLPRFEEAMHVEILQTMKDMGIDVILGERLDLDSVSKGTVNSSGQRVVKTVTGREVIADLLLLCTGQKFNTEIMQQMDPATVDPKTSLIHILRTMQVAPLSSPSSSGMDTGPPKDTPYPHIFAVGDVADAFGAIAAGHTAYNQSEVAARNVIHLIKRLDRSVDAELEDELEDYTPGPPAIKVSLGLKKSVYQRNGQVATTYDGVDDLHAPLIWPLFGVKPENEEQLYD